MFHPATLRANCVKKTCEVLMNGMWDRVEDNPFSSMPISVVQGLLSCLWPEESELLSEASLTHSRLLLTSGRLEHVTLSRAHGAGDYVTLLRMLSAGCQNLRSLTVRCIKYDGLLLESLDVEQAIQELLPNCVKLERLHTCVLFEPNCLRNCKNLKVLRFHYDVDETHTFLSGITSDLLKRLGSIEVFANCDRALQVVEVEDELGCRMRATAKLLDMCPQLTSLGFLDSSSALKELHDTDLKAFGTPRRFQLRRCYWDVGPGMSQSEYSDRIRAAALLCPMIEVLVIEVRHAIGLRYLETMMNLTRLTIDLNHDINEFRECFSLLEKIGPQLRYLSVCSFHEEPLSVNVICENCPNLRTLLLECAMTVDEGVQTCATLLNLERLCVNELDRKTLFFLLSNCPHLKVLFLESCKKLKDEVMQDILKENPFAELEVAMIGEFRLSETGCSMFFRSAVKLINCCLVTPLLSDDDLMRLVRDLNPGVVCHSRHAMYDLAIKQFPPENSSSCWF